MSSKPDSGGSSTGAAPTATVCGNCGVEEKRLLHHVRHRGTLRRLCTTCVLRLHPQSFCPTCFAVYETTPPSASGHGTATVTCFKCYSSSHAHCVGPTIPNPYICPICVNPNTPIFNPKRAKDIPVNKDNGDGGNAEIAEYRIVDKDSAKVLLAAAKISSVSMNKAAAAARAEAERRAKEAAFTRKRAKEAVDHVANLYAKEMLKKKETEVLTPVPVSGGNVGERSSAAGTFITGRVGNANVNMNVNASVNVNNKNISNNNNPDNSGEVLAALNAVELKEKERSGGIRALQTLNNSGAAMDVAGNGFGAREMVVENSVVGNVIERTGVLMENGNEQQVNDGAVASSVGDQLQHFESSQSGEQINSSGMQQ